jgi:4,4'-diaponeurosporenoate glycosyltransferase
MHTTHAIALGGWLLGWVLLWRVPRIRRGAAHDALGPVTVIVPARNEARRLPALLERLAPGLPANVRVLVVDDHSTDGTADVARRWPAVSVVPAPDLPPGWKGKPWACHTGAAAAPDGELVFVDADVRLTAPALLDAVAARRRDGGVVSIWPYHHVERPYEHLSALFNVVALMSLGAGSALPPRRMREAMGPVLLTSSADYRTVGGHEAVRGEITESLALGRRYADAGFDNHVYGGDADISLRMYADGFRALVEGWTKSVGPGAGAIHPFRMLGVSLWVFCSFGAWLWYGGLPKPWSVALSLLFAAQMYVMFRQVGRFGIVDALLFPLHTTFLALIFLWSLFRTHVLKRVSWRGRSYPSAP